MYRKILHRKILLFFLLFTSLAILQIILLDQLSLERIVQFIIFDLCILIGYYSFRGFELDTMKSYNAVLVSSIMGSLFGSLFSIVIILIIYTSRNDFSRWDMVATVLFSVIAFPVINQIFYHLMQNIIPPSRYYILGSQIKYKKVMQEIAQAAHGKVKVVEWIEHPKHLELKITQRNHCDVILVADWKLYQNMQEEVEKCQKKGYQKKFITNLAEKWLCRIPLELAEEYGDYYEAYFSDVTLSKGKRVFDIVMAGIIGIMGLPFILFSGLSVMLTSGFPVIFKHRRVGLYETEFMFYKFRTLKMLKQTELAMMPNPNGTIENRVTLIGKGLRRTRFDEFPQFINIINGSMSLVGPRPEMVNYHDQFRKKIPFYSYRNSVPPGLTGWAQIQYNHTSTLEEYKRKTEYDLYYIKNKSVLLDLQIILLTIETMLGMRGSR